MNDERPIDEGAGPPLPEVGATAVADEATAPAATSATAAAGDAPAAAERDAALPHDKAELRRRLLERGEQEGPHGAVCKQPRCGNFAATRPRP